jgi:hypothetical protein
VTTNGRREGRRLGEAGLVGHNQWEMRREEAIAKEKGLGMEGTTNGKRERRSLEGSGLPIGSNKNQ